MKKFFGFLLIFLCSFNLLILSAGAQKKGRWSADEDQRLQNGVRALGENAWGLISDNFVLTRSPRQCRERWHYAFSPTRNPNWTDQEDNLLIRLTQQMLTWGQVFANFPNRTPQNIVNRYDFLGYVGDLDAKLEDLRVISVNTSPKYFRWVVAHNLVDTDEDSGSDNSQGNTVIPSIPRNVSEDPLPQCF